tara:strand:+ start:478 stop:630 length:153 start_codon:yes stop_codon:yes gene_type:complete
MIMSGLEAAKSGGLYSFISYLCRIPADKFESIDQPRNGTLTAIRNDKLTK